MQSNSLLDNLNSDFMAALSSLLPKTDPQRILVYVESDEDITFWSNILNTFEGYTFDIQLPIKDALEKGKSAVLDRIEQAGPYLILCVDSDYDYFLQDITEQSTNINNNQFVFQTYSYSIENMFCFSRSLRSVCTQSTKNNDEVINIVNLLELYSQITYELLIWSVFFERRQDFTSFERSDFHNTIKILDRVDLGDNFKVALDGLKHRVENKLASLKTKFSNHVEAVKNLQENLQQLGLGFENTYLFINGHVVKDNVVLMFLESICQKLKRDKYNQIRENAKHQTDIRNQINHYNKHFIPIETALRNNTEFKSCFLYEKIYADLNIYVENLNSA
jgi:hypothetical protein